MFNEDTVDAAIQGSGFCIVLLTPNDYGYAKPKADEVRQTWARQNVVLEVGMILASLGCNRMVLLKKGAFELPTNVNGVIYLEFNDHVKEIAVKLATHMKGVGIEIDDTLLHNVDTCLREMKTPRRPWL